MQVSVLLSLIGSLLAPSGAYILGRCVVAKKLRDGGLDYYEGYGLANWVCLAYFESKFNPSAVYENPRSGYTGYGLFQIRDNEWCDHGINLCSVSCSALLKPDLKKTIQCAKKIVKGKKGMAACYWGNLPNEKQLMDGKGLFLAYTFEEKVHHGRPSWSQNCQLSDTLDRWLEGCKL